MKPSSYLHLIKLTDTDSISHNFNQNQPSELDKLLESIKGFLDEPYQIELLAQIDNTGELIIAGRDFQRLMERSCKAAILVEPLTEQLMKSVHALIMYCGHADREQRPQEPVAIQWVYQVSGAGLALSSGIKIGDTPWSREQVFVAKH